MGMLEVVVNGRVVGYARDDEMGRKCAEHFAFEMLASGKRRVEVHHVRRVPQGARRIDK